MFSKKRKELGVLLKQITGLDTIYFQPTNNVSMKYPCIVYSRDEIDTEYANNQVYKKEVSYNITVIDKNPDSELLDKVSQIPRCRHDRHYIQDNLNHDVFVVFFN